MLSTVTFVDKTVTDAKNALGLSGPVAAYREQRNEKVPAKRLGHAAAPASTRSAAGALPDPAAASGSAPADPDCRGRKASRESERGDATP